MTDKNESFRACLQSSDWQSGYNAGLSGLSSSMPLGVDALSWLSGYIEGKVKSKTKTERNINENQSV